VDYETGRSFVGDLANALEVARTEQFVADRGDRVGSADIIIVLSNGGVAVDTPAVSIHIFTPPRLLTFQSQIFSFIAISLRHDTIRDAILTCSRKPT